MAAHLHDSVLQTLTLIQNRSDEPEIAAALAHQQERQLRRWLYGGDSGSAAATPTLRAALELTAAEVEDQYLKIVECIVVGDTPMSPPLDALVGATREAIVNAAKFAQAPDVSVYAEVDQTDDRAVTVRAFVRDRGVGFDPGNIPPDRHGIADSIHGRLERVGGAASVRSTIGHGTEVRLRWPA
jgi:signal transduction histidine kinase